VCLLARCLIAAAFAFAPLAWAQTWPVKPIRLIVNFPAGSGPDVLARIYAPGLGEALGQPVVVENRVGAAGNIGVEAVAKSAPDGYTLLNTGVNAIVVNPHVYKLGVDVAKDLVPVVPTTRISAILVVAVRPSLPVHSVADLIAYAKANPNKLSYGTPGSGTTLHIAAEMLLRAATIQATHVPYSGSGQVLAALLGDQIDFAFDPGVAMPLIKSGKLRLLAVASATRSPFFPDTPTMAEAGTDINTSIVNGVFAPAGTPREIVVRLNREIGRIMQTAEARAAIAGISSELVTASPEEFAALMRRDRERFGAMVREANIRVD
jgi:tripartite-type tricarboxylate transporter receptor subunit TctC